jgi:hypothetical protein
MPQKKRVPTYVASIKDSLDRKKKEKHFTTM